MIGLAPVEEEANAALHEAWRTQGEHWRASDLDRAVEEVLSSCEYFAIVGHRMRRECVEAEKPMEEEAVLVVVELTARRSPLD